MSYEEPGYSERDRRVQLHSFTDLDEYARTGAPVIERGEGIYLVDTAGRRYLDAMSSLWCATLGYSQPRLVAAANAQLERLPYSHSFRGRSHPLLVELAEKLVEISPPGLERAFFACSGSEANESAIKMAWAYHRQRGMPEKRSIISRCDGYHGSTLFASRLTGMAAMHDAFGGKFPEILFAECPAYHRDARAGETEADFAARMAQGLETLIEREGADRIAAFIAEPVMGVGGVILPPHTYFERVQEILRRHDILLIADEVICGFGRTGQMFGSATFAIEPDILTLAKGLSAAYFPISATLVSAPIYSALRDNSASHGVFSHGFTYSGHPVGAAVALETLAILEEEDIPRRVRQIAPRFQAAVARCCDIEIAMNPRGVGLMAAFDLVRDKSSGESFEPGFGAGGLLMQFAESNDLFVRTVGDTVVLAPPLVISDSEIEELEQRLSKSLHALYRRTSGG